MKWKKSKNGMPEPLADDNLTFVLISWPEEANFRDYATIYYAPCDDKWYRDIDTEEIPKFDYWCYITNPTKQLHYGNKTS